MILSLLQQLVEIFDVLQTLVLDPLVLHVLGSDVDEALQVVLLGLLLRQFALRIRVLPVSRVHLQLLLSDVVVVLDVCYLLGYFGLHILQLLLVS